MIELTLGRRLLGTANTSFGTLAVGDPAGHNPRELLQTAVAGCRRLCGWIMLELHRPQADTVDYVKRAYERATVLLSSDARDGPT